MTAAQIAPPDDTASPPRKGGGLKRLLVLLLVSALMGGAGFGAGWYYFGQGDSAMTEALRLIEREDPTEEATDPNAPQKTPRPMPGASAFVTSYHPMTEPLTTNPAGSRRFLQVGVTLSTQYDAQVIENVKTHEAAVRSDMLAVMGSFSEDQLAGLEGREALALALRDAINARMEKLEGFGGIEGVFFTSFVLQ